MSYVTQPALFANFKRHLEKFIPLGPEEFEQVLSYFSVKRLKKRASLIRAGDNVRHTYWTSKGLLTSSFTDGDGKEHIIQFANENCWITDQNAFYNQTKAIFNIVCMEDTELLVLSYDNREKCAPKCIRWNISFAGRRTIALQNSNKDCSPISMQTLRNVTSSYCMSIPIWFNGCPRKHLPPTSACHVRH